ncbi:hypothetical protein FBU31_004548, partial [Coemansia sp. 'formosensis']
QWQLNITCIAQLPIVAGPTWDSYPCIVVPVCYDAIVGILWMVQNNAHIDWDRCKIITRFGIIPEFVPPPFPEEGRESEVAALAYIDVSPQDDLWHVVDMIHDAQQFIELNAIDALTDGQESNINSSHPAVARLMEQYADRLHDTLPDELPPWHPQDPCLELCPDAELKNCPIYRMSASELEGLHKVLDELLA